MLKRVGLRVKPCSGVRFQSALTSAQSSALSRILRVDHAGELGAYQIYKGQLLVLSRTHPHLTSLINEMKAQEEHHMNTFNKLMADHRVRPTLLTPLWHAGGYALGAVTAAIGAEGAMACTEAVETVIGGHYNDQLRELSSGSLKDIDKSSDEMQNLLMTIKQFRDDELEHLDTAIEHDSKNVGTTDRAELICRRRRIRFYQLLLNRFVTVLYGCLSESNSRS